MYRKANAGHVGCSLSCAELLTFVRLDWMREGDDLILSKGHAAAALYSVLAEAGDLSEEAIATFYADGTHLAAHPPPNRVPGIPFATGSLGHGLSLAAGRALAAKLRGEDGRVFCVTSDGELNEGSIWEAALFAAHQRLTNLVWLVDRNGIQGFGRTEEVMELEPLGKKLEAFGWRVDQVDGHDFESLAMAKKNWASRPWERPTVIVARTTKGKGLGKLEDTVDCHYLPLTPESHEQVLGEISG